MLMATANETGFLKKFGKKKSVALAGMVILSVATSCSASGPEPIALNKDNCDYCKMTISNKRFATELITSKGRVYKFDDVSCMINYKKENSNTASAKYYICDYLEPNALLKADSLFYVSGDEVGSPMGGNIAAFSNSDSAQAFLLRISAQPLVWSQLSE